jgi:non-ribosomal peptide synthetase-like protein
MPIETSTRDHSTLGVAAGSQIAEPLARMVRGPVRPEFIRDELLDDLFSATVAATPYALCMIEGEQRLTYVEVDHRAAALAAGLVRKGIKPGHVIGLWMPRGADLLIAQIAIAKTGAAWLPFDADAPFERICICLSDADAQLLLTSSAFAEATQHHNAPCPVIVAHDLIDTSDRMIVTARGQGATPDDPAYLIYTSGSTGTPKGIVITGRNICHYVRAAVSIYGLRSDDLVFQGASVAFDLSMEEIWAPYVAGAALFVATPALMGEPDRLPDVMEAAGVTVLDTVPTLLMLLPRDIASLRIIILGGEACPPAIAARWCRSGRVIFNTYGPTEATVVATYAEVRPNEIVTIGKPIPNYSCYVVDEQMRCVDVGVEGELLIGGPGVAAGYLKRDDLTQDRFIANPFASDGSDPILYRSGDAVALNGNGDLLFRGRIDDQVKIRGFRVELGEIEAKIAELEGVAQAAVVLRPENGIDQLIAFVTVAKNTAVDMRQWRSRLRMVLPAYMVPAAFEIVDELPRLSSGKVNRKQLKTQALTQTALALDEQEEPRTATEAALLAAAQAVLPPQPIPFDADFFSDLGGHSLLAARFVGIVRQQPALTSLSLHDMYQQRTLRALADLLDGRVRTQAPPQDLSFEPPPLLRRFLCGLAQAIALPFIIGLVTLQWLGLFIASVFLIQDNAGIITEMGMMFAIYTVINLGSKAIIVALKWLVIGRTKPGRYPLWGVYYFRLWFVRRLVQVTTIKFLQCSPLMPFYLRLLGAKIGKDVIISEFECGAIDLLTIGDRASLGTKCRYVTFEVVGNEVIVGPITIGADVHIGNSCVIGSGAELEQGVVLNDLTSVAPDQKVEAFTHLDGSPPRKIGVVDLKELPPFPEVTRVRRLTLGAGYIAAYIVILMIGLVPIFPAFYVLYNLDSLFDGTQDYAVSWSQLPFLAWPTSFVLTIVSVMIIIVVRWLVLPRVTSGQYSIYSAFYFRKWMVALATEVLLETLNSLYATVYMPYWYRAMGTRIGKGSEVSTNLAGRYDLVNIGANNFIGDEVVFGDEEIRGGYMTLRTVTTGDRVFIGNDAVIEQGAVIADDTLIGIKSKLPSELTTDQGGIYFGSPALKFPNRQRVSVGIHQTYAPPKSFVFFRHIFEAFHTPLPTALFIALGYITADILSEPLDVGDYTQSAIIFFLSGLVIALLLVAFSVILKWLLMGVYKPTMWPMWSWAAIKTEAVAVVYGGLVGIASLEFFRGTPFLPWLLRLYGTKIGKGVYLDCIDFTEFDCVSIGDYCVLNDHSVPQTHLYEDRVMKVGRIYLEKGVTIGTGATVLYDTHVGEFAQIGQLSVVMKGEDIPAHTQWVGIPPQRMTNSQQMDLGSQM